MINIFANQWFDFMANNFIQLTIFLGIITLFSFIFRKSSPLFLYCLWFLGFIKAILPPKISLPFFTKTIQSFDIILPKLDVSTSVSSSVISYKIILFLLWLITIIFLILYQILMERNFNKRLSNSKLADYSTIVLELKNKMKIKRKIQIYFSENITIPFTHSFLKSKIYLPKKAKEWEEQEIYAVLAHEIAHIKRNDNIQILIQEIIFILYFFHPIMWFARKQLNFQREKICHEMAIGAIKYNHIDYGKCILANLESCFKMKRISAFSIGFLFSKKSIIRRFEYILNRKEDNMLKLKTIHKIVIISLITIGLLFACNINKNGKSILDKSKFVVYDEPPVVLQRIQPEYPEIVKKAGIEGTIWLDAEVKKDGTVGKVEVKKNNTGSDLLAKASVEAMKKWKFEPAKKDGKAITCWIAFPVTFSIK
ncbi:MAG: hypothetical protein DRJ01_09800 [Bacteroidetes bacterium]|nr:MAG: hypothetical protein DRJ01_09800 [Bacteroidota bacterium]